MAEDFQEQVHSLQGFEIRKKGKSIHLWTRITSWILPGPLLPKKPKAYTSMRKVVYINKFVAGYENLFYLKCSSEKKRLNTNVKRENDICLCTHFR